jgi:type I restriction enzyme S subunit
VTLDWNPCTVQDFIDAGEAFLKTGPFGTQLKASEYVDEGTPVINVRNIGFGDIRTEKLDYLPDPVVDRLSDHLLQPNDIVFGRKGAVERHAFIRQAQDNWFQGSDCLRLRFKSDSVDPQFVSYCLLTQEHKDWMVNQCSHGATMTSLNQDIVSRIPLHLPPLPTQYRIAAVLSAYDDLIENNTQRIAALEAAAQALYREWFVEMRFPGHESADWWDSELGRIPVGWEVKPFGEVTHNFDKKRIPVSKIEREKMRGEYPYYGASGVVDYVNDYIFDGRYLLIAEDGENLRSRKTPIAFFATGRFWVNNHAHIVQGKEFVSSEYLKIFIDNLDVMPYITGAAQPKLSQTNMNRIAILIADQQTHLEFDEFAGNCFAEIDLLEQKNAVLREVRDQLLPRLISGELLVDDMEVLEVRL